MRCENGGMPQVPTEILVPLRWSDMDAYGHVNNVQFVRLLEDARVAMLIEWFPDGLGRLDRGIVVARHEIDYLAPLEYRPEPVAVDVWVTRMGGGSYDIGYIVRDPDGVGPGLRYAVAETTLALFDVSAGVSRRMEPQERAVIASHLGEPAPLRRHR